MPCTASFDKAPRPRRACCQASRCRSTKYLPLASAPLLAGMRETLYRLALPRATRHMALQLGSLGDDAAVAGMTRLVVDQEFSPGTVNARLRG